MGEPSNLRVLVADEQQIHLETVSGAVEELGHDVISHVVEIAKVGRATLEHRPDIAIVVLHEDTRHALELISEIVDEATCPVVVLATDARPDFVEQAAERGVFAHLDSTDPGELRGGIDIAIQRFREYRKLLGAFDRRARIERAKGLLMERHGIDERSAFERIRGEARNARRPLIDVVDELLDEGVSEPAREG
jgi:AmiR/NasT family two-component response regulator